MTLNISHVFVVLVFALAPTVSLAFVLSPLLVGPLFFFINFYMTE